ncbi:MAG TPA: tRNA cyclic N6-threonylcarbamoyladenosine(37) synthase TcdA [Verrucomicrobiales bacterium]|nr:MAG: tRNA cyclic N6-threonylcarbamoyladenosine(37) synthase TcdA [Verrucomicrobiae bacterium Tous-C3TDCM]PAZ04795.1 MAG: tRNA cyclic N6-threonylcarbamoyladenosine(37) synthase TcdA [Verrucomicrobiae bacterium AMD-G2]HBE22403.1 tRNA cyclic N6-threonylcarbamoyladenosine(37) synthase TcdA [Verrucomicrobiales bacterium]
MRFSGISRLYGARALERFHQAHVTVIGIGGVGSWIVEALARSGIGQITMVDLDEICVTNVNRQLHAMDGQIGRLKTTAMAERIHAIHPDCQITEKQTFYSEKNADELLASSPDVVIDAIDAVRQKCHLIAECKIRGIPIVTVGAAGGRRDPSCIQIADLAMTCHDALLLQTRKNLRAHHGFPKAPTGKKIKKFGVTAVFSSESPVFPQCDGSVSTQRPEGTNLRLSCDSGYGTATPVTATFGMIAAAQALEILQKSVTAS